MFCFFLHSDLNIFIHYNYRKTKIYVQLFTSTTATCILHYDSQYKYKNFQTHKKNYCYLDIKVSEKGSSGKNLVCSERRKHKKSPLLYR